MIDKIVKGVKGKVEKTGPKLYLIADMSILANPEKWVGQLESQQAAEQAFGTLTPTERNILEMHFGEGDKLAEIGRELNIDAEHVRQIKNLALRKLRHPSRSKLLQEFL